MANPGQPNQTDQTANFFWLLCLMFGAVLVVWWLYRQAIVVPVYWFRIHEVILINYVATAWKDLFGWLHISLPDVSQLKKLQFVMQNTDFAKTQFQQFALVNSYIGDYMRYPCMFVLALLAVFVYFRHGASRFRRVYNMDTLRNVEVENWPQIKPVLSIDLVKEDANKGPWAMAKTPLDFAKHHELLCVKEVDGRKVYGVHRGPAMRAFTVQLGRLWEGADTLPIHVKALLVIFLSRASKERDVSLKFLRQIAGSAGSGQLNFAGVEEYLQKYKKLNALKWSAKRHAYVYTVMATLLEIARSDGVLASAEFLWLKPLDRRLWYVLNSVGRQTAVVEASGPFSHWKAELKIGRALRTPMLTKAVDGLEEALEDVLHVPEEEKWHTNDAA